LGFVFKFFGIEFVPSFGIVELLEPKVLIINDSITVIIYTTVGKT
jgi:hypothetical protein